MITREDVERAAVEDGAPPQRTVEKMTRGPADGGAQDGRAGSAPTFSVEVEIDVTEAMELHTMTSTSAAVATRDELYVPVVREADRKPLAAIAAETRELAAKVRDGTISPAELEGGRSRSRTSACSASAASSRS